MAISFASVALHWPTRLRDRPSAEEDRPRHPSLDGVREKEVAEGLVSFLSVLLTRLGPGVGGR